ncbi:MAG TPA: glycosyltransferase [Gemmatimonadaceae bacterium]|nr:glycosyltransferase [Gemmatimonadaceae bacterium]
MRIAEIVEYFPAVSETFILRQMVGLAALGHKVDVFSNRRPQDEYVVHEQVHDSGLDRRVRYVHGGRPVPQSLARDAALALRLAVQRPSVLRMLGRDRSAPYGGRRSLLPRLKVLAGRGGYDVVHCHFGTVGLAYRFAAEYWNAPLVVSFHGIDYSRDPLVFGPRVYEPLFEIANAVTVNCAYARDRLEQLGCPREKLHILHLGVDPSDYTFRERRENGRNEVRILTVARLVEKKGVEYALRAVAQVACTTPGVHYEIIGDGPLREELESLARSLGVDGCVTFRGSQEQHVVRSAMWEADIFLLPSVTAKNGDQEGTPTVIIEASSSGLPVVSTFHSGIPEVVLDGRTGCLVPERDASALADRLRFLIAHPEVRSTMGRAGRRHIEQEFDIRALNRQLEGIYTGLVAQRHAPQPTVA